MSPFLISYEYIELESALSRAAAGRTIPTSRRMRRRRFSLRKVRNHRPCYCPGEVTTTLAARITLSPIR